MKELNNYLSPILILLIIILSYQLYNLPSKINNSINGDGNNVSNDTVIINKPDNLVKRNELFYFNGKIINNGVKIIKKFEYDPMYPEEFLNGYINLAQSKTGGKYYIWSPFKGYNNDKLDGWFISMTGNWQSGEDYIPIIIPIVERDKN